MSYPFIQSSCFCNCLFLSFIETYVYCLSCFIRVLILVTKVDTDPKPRLCHLRLLALTTEFSVFMHNIMEQLARGNFFEGQQNYIKNKNEGNENKIILGDFNCTMNKMDRNCKKNTKNL